MSSDVVLTSALRSNLLSLQRTQSNIDKVQNALATGLKVSSALDNPQSFFAARSLSNRASDLSGLLDGIGQAISGIKQANTSVEKLTKLVEQADSIVNQAADAAAEARIASVTGDVDLSEVDDITDLAGVAASDQLVITVSNPDKAAVTYTITAVFSANDSIDQILAKINSSGNGTFPNGSYDSAGEAVIEASITSDGYLKIEAANGGNIRIDFEAAETNAAVDDPTNLAFARALGFGGTAQLVNEAGTSVDQAVQVTAVAGGRLTSGVFYDSAADGSFAQASDLLSTVLDAASGGNARFVTSTTGTDNLSITINNTTTVNIAIDQNATTIQGLVDGINTNATLNKFVKAEYDADTGQFSIEKISSKVNTVEIGLSPASGGLNTGNVEADFDFGLTQLLVATDTRTVSEVFTFGSAAGQLAQLESDYNKVRDQIDQLVDDSPYTGANLLKGEVLTTYFNADRSNFLETIGQDLTTGGLGLDAADFANDVTIGEYRTAVKGALDQLRSFGGSLANDLSIIQAREEFTKETISNLTEGADKLTVADQNEEGAKLLALQTRQQLGVTALSLAAQAQQSVLRLF